jgi:transposase
MKVVYPICCGLDVHKNVIVATIASTDGSGITAYEQRSIETLNPDLRAMRDWLLERGCLDVCMESTGKYWIPVFNVLEGHVNVVLTHPKYVRAIKGKKTDKKDSKWIADLFKHDLVRTSFMPPKDIRECREISRYRFKLVCMRSSEKNRYQNCLTVSNVGLGSVLSDCFGKTAQGIMRQLASPDGFDEEACLKLIKGQARKKASRIIDSVRDCDIGPDQRFKIEASMGHMDYLDDMIARCELELYVRMRPHWGAVELLCGMPGITELSACLILSETGVDMSQFEDAGHLCSWAGLVPGNNESANKKKSVRITKAGQFLKPVLVQCALAAVKSADEDYFAIKYRRLKKRRGHKKAAIAIARMMLVCIYHMLATGELFNPTDYEELKDPKPEREPVPMTEESALAFLAAQGYDISKIVAAV